MSCIILEKNSVEFMMGVVAVLERNNKILAYLLPEKYKTASFEEMAKVALALNLKSYGVRYGESVTDSQEKVTIPYIIPSIKNMAQAFKTARCLLYNSSDFAGCESDPDYLLVKTLKDFIGNMLIEALPDYNAAKWG